MAVDVAMNDMEIDFTMDEPDPEIARLQAEAEAINAQASDAYESAMNVTEAPEEGEFDATEPAVTKIHVRGLNQLNTFDIEAWVKEHEQADLFQRVQWVDDTSANLIFDNEIAAAEALAVLSTEETTDPMQLRVAKRLSTHPDTDLQIRLAVVSDVKAPKAKERSAFYLFNRDWDPDNPDNIRPDRKRKRYDNAYRSNKLRRREPEGPVFSEDMYDDNPEAVARRTSYSSGSEYGRNQRVRGGRELMDDRRGKRLRDRSASPIGEGDGRYGFNDSGPRRRTARARSRTPPGIRSGKDNHAARDNLRKELFPDRKGSSALTNGASNGAGASDRDPPTPNPPRELFPDKVGTPIHRRQDAQDLHPDEVARAIGEYTLDGTADTSHARTYSRAGRRPEREREGGRDLFARIEGGPKSHGRLGSSDASGKGDGFNIKGANPGFSILGASRERGENPLVKELFPVKAGGTGVGGGKDLFDGRIKGRGAQRRRAEDMF